MQTEVTVFLGAGASIPFGLPGTKRFIEEVEVDLKRHSQRIHQIRETVRNFGLNDDVESLLSVLNFWENPSRTIYESGSFIAEIANAPIHRFKRNKKDAIIARRVKEYIVKRCFVYDADVISSIMKVYVPFFEGIHNKFNLPECNPRGRNPCPEIDIFTTNYDNTIEIYGTRNGTPVCDGYGPYFGSSYCFDPKNYVRAQDGVRLHKLHGTVTYARLEDNSIERLNFFPRRGPLIINGNLAFPDLIYPGINACLAKEPYLELLYNLKRTLTESKICIVIGYSFPDPHIRHIFQDTLQKNHTLKIFLVSRNPDKIIKEKKLSTKVFIPVSKRFEDLNVERDIVV